MTTALLQDGEIDGAEVSQRFLAKQLLEWSAWLGTRAGTLAHVLVSSAMKLPKSGDPL